METKQQVLTRIEKKATALQERLGFTLSKAQAIAQVTEAEPALYADYKNAPDELPLPPPPNVQKAAFLDMQSKAKALAARENTSVVDAIMKLAQDKEAVDARVIAKAQRSASCSTVARTWALSGRPNR